ncbi:PqqD family protein [Aphanizomenon sp. CS-733/32]|uniref:PqqD family protein n=1 Tax=Aphanizomenon sp. CS-733/32 TaxID=3021715 RepID=UPI002330C4ED|nr:PqqD family protein [Aphanizomenon sp. CS-733/32]MDB9310667.1 PqqD family protein [Aphanizomenon sp. CS-733/32]
MTSIFSMRVSVPPTTLSQELEGQVVLLNLKNEYYYSLNPVGSQMWNLLSTHDNLETVYQELLKKYLVDESTIRQDLASLVEELTTEGLLTITSSI